MDSEEEWVVLGNSDSLLDDEREWTVIGQCASTLDFDSECQSLSSESESDIFNTGIDTTTDFDTGANRRTDINVTDTDELSLEDRWYRGIVFYDTPGLQAGLYGMAHQQQEDLGEFVDDKLAWKEEVHRQTACANARPRQPIHYTKHNVKRVATLKCNKYSSGSVSARARKGKSRR